MGRLEGIYVTGQAGETPRSVERAVLRAHRGLDGDRYAEGSGTFSGRGPKDKRRPVTLMEQEAVEAVGRELGTELEARIFRRNLLVSGISLLELVGREFRIGALRFQGLRTCPPCGHLDRLTGLDTRQVLKGRGGIVADVLDDGAIRTGDPVEVLDPTRAPAGLPRD